VFTISRVTYLQRINMTCFILLLMGCGHPIRARRLQFNASKQWVRLLLLAKRHVNLTA
jgi:hypothetical protein